MNLRCPLAVTVFQARLYYGCDDFGNAGIGIDLSVLQFSQSVTSCDRANLIEEMLMHIGSLPRTHLVQAAEMLNYGPHILLRSGWRLDFGADKAGKAARSNRHSR